MGADSSLDVFRGRILQDQVVIAPQIPQGGCQIAYESAGVEEPNLKTVQQVSPTGTCQVFTANLETLEREIEIHRQATAFAVQFFGEAVYRPPRR